MSILSYKPARDARHRAACLALYRSLLRLTTRIPLPPSLATSGPLRSASSPTGQNPLRALITRSFTLHRPLTSPRLIASALSQGYRFLSLLASQSPTPTPRLLAFLEANAGRLASHRAARAALRAKYAPGRDLVPLVTKVADNPPRYEPTRPPRPVAEGKVRWVPTYGTCGEIPFVRMRGRQSFVLSAFLNRKLVKRRERMELLQVLETEKVEEAGEEDAWEELVGVRDPGGTWAGEAERGRWALSGVLKAEARDMVARSRAYWKVLEEERRAAGWEKMRRKRAEREGRAIGGAGEGGKGVDGKGR
ncbi:hypothetical protein QBC39DRAFT_402789 [Podospora conica]|nr:hypothetical protein QBC39DRAFT_402789 [Schizothecium conicum]